VPVEIFVIGDGVDEETQRVALRLTEVHANVRYFDYPREPRHGEVHRHEALRQASGRIVCYLSDDDLYLPHHVAEMSRLLNKADFAHALAVRAEPGGDVATWTVDLNLEAHRRELLRGGNRIPLSAGAHTLEMYRSLEEGRSSATEGTPTDLFMWRKFLQRPDCRFSAGTRPSVLVLPSARWRSMSVGERREELLSWADRLGSMDGVAELEGQILSQKVGEAASLDSVLRGVQYREALPQCDTFQLFFPDDEGHNERRSVTFLLEIGSWKTIELQIPCETPGIQIRLDPGTQPCLIELAQLEVTDEGRTIVWRLTESNRSELTLADTAVWLGGGAWRGF